MAMAGCNWPLDDTGPDKVEALLEFPLQAWHDLQRAEHHGILLPGAVDQALRHLRDGIFGFSSYTGIAAWELGAFYTEQAAELLGLMGTSGSAGRPLALQMVEAWDLKATAQEVILDMGIAKGSTLDYLETVFIVVFVFWLRMFIHYLG